MVDKEWKDYARGLIKGELARRNINYVELASLLKKVGAHENSQNLSNKIARGTFSSVFFLQVLHVIGCENVELKKND
jgi:hypothetical protein